MMAGFVPGLVGLLLRLARGCDWPIPSDLHPEVALDVLIMRSFETEGQSVSRATRWWEQREALTWSPDPASARPSPDAAILFLLPALLPMNKPVLCVLPAITAELMQV